MNDLRRHRRGERRVQLGAMHAEIRRAVETLGHRQLVGHLPRVPHAVEMRVGRERDALQPLLETDPAQHLHRVRHHLDARSDPRESRRLLVHAHVEPRAPQSRGDGEPAHAGADDRDRALCAAHSILNPVALTIGVHRATSARVRREAVSGSQSATSSAPPCSRSRAKVSSAFALAVAWDSASIAVAGVPAGAKIALNTTTCKPGRPDSIAVGMSGAALTRAALLTARMRKRPARWWPTTEVERIIVATAMCPAMRSWSAGPPPLYGTCTRSSPPASSLKSSPVKFVIVPWPAEPYEYLPGLALISATSARRLCAGIAGCTSIDVGVMLTTAIGVKSLTGS